MQTYTKATFEMFWDCPACDRTKNIGVTHAFCPGCGHKQPPERRYFPTPAQRRSVVPPDHGRQVTCGYCQVSNNPNHAHCQACGALLGGAKPVPLRPSIPEHQGSPWSAPRRRGAGRTLDDVLQELDVRPPRDPPEPTSGSGHERLRHPVAFAVVDEPVTLSDYGISRGFGSAAHWTAALVGAAMVLLTLLVLLWKKDIVVEVQGHTWERTIAVERFKSAHDSAWCSSKPSDAYNVSRRRELHHVNHVPDGQTCRTVPGSESCRNVDNGNGSGSTVCTRTPSRQECQTRYRDEPVYADKCYYDVDRWRHQRDARASGSRISPDPAWPQPEFQSCTITRLGCERLGPRTQQYLVHFVSAEADRKSFECEYPQPRWASYKPGSTWNARVGVLWQRLDCDSLTGAR
jgi:hypothetical protein